MQTLNYRVAGGITFGCYLFSLSLPVSCEKPNNLIAVFCFWSPKVNTLRSFVFESWFTNSKSALEINIVWWLNSWDPEHFLRKQSHVYLFPLKKKITSLKSVCESNIWICPLPPPLFKCILYYPFSLTETLLAVTALGGRNKQVKKSPKQNKRGKVNR